MARSRTATKEQPGPQQSGTSIPLTAIIEIIDWQIGFYEGEDKQALIKASDAIYDHLHKDDPDQEYGN